MYRISDLTADQSERLAWSVVATTSAVVAAMATRSALQGTWKLVRNDDPPLQPASLDTSWKDAIAWTVVTGVGAGMARLVARRAAAASWRDWKGTLPPGFESRGA